MRITKLFSEFFKSESSGGLILLFCTLISLILVNSPLGEQYEHLWHIKIGQLSLSHWINDLLMAVFFLLVGLEIEREIYVGELKSPGKAIFPIIAALGGMLIPAGLYLGININAENQDGFGIPMATDIAFALGMLSLLGSRIPLGVKIFITALAIIDDLGAIIVIAIFYTEQLRLDYLCYAGIVYAVLLLLNRLNVQRVLPYLILGLVMWFFMLQSGVHATLTQTCRIFHFTLVCFSQYRHFNQPNRARWIYQFAYFGYYGRFIIGKTNWNSTFYIFCRKTQNCIPTRRCQLEPDNRGFHTGRNRFYDEYFHQYASLYRRIYDKYF